MLMVPQSTQLAQMVAALRSVLAGQLLVMSVLVLLLQQILVLEAVVLLAVTVAQGELVGLAGLVVVT
jgi:hypothetical protein